MMKSNTMASNATTIDVIMTQRRLYRGTRGCSGWTCGECESSFELFKSPVPVLSLVPNTGTPAAVVVTKPAG